MELLKIFCVILLAVFFGVSFANWKMPVKYKTDFVVATSTESIGDYLSRQGNDGWDLWGYKDYNDGRQYIFKK